ncbi:MAG: hypothetical protein JW760_10205 [Spirochaetales bacterium]|nr:hypothetical protein [Spirochaetales bacterium]
MSETEGLSCLEDRKELFECTALSAAHNFFMPTYVSKTLRAFLPPHLLELSLDSIFASLERELTAGKGDNPLSFSCLLPVRSPRAGYVLFPAELSARLYTAEEGVFAVVSLQGEEPS